MKKKLLSPPKNDGEILLLPTPENFFTSNKIEQTLGVCHQPYFFNPGVSLKFILWENLNFSQKKLWFLDTDKINLSIKIPLADNKEKHIILLQSDKTLHDYPTPPPDTFKFFWETIEKSLKDLNPSPNPLLRISCQKFKNITLKHLKEPLLKNLLVKSFLEFYDIKAAYRFCSELFLSSKFQEFFLTIYNNHQTFKTIFNEALDNYKQTFRFRYKNFPFPKLEENELPFWLIKNGTRHRCFIQDINKEKLENTTLFPKASTLTLFLRLYHCHIFIHGIGGGNYEWIQDQILKNFFKQEINPFLVISGTFLLNSVRNRELPFFFFDPQLLKKQLLSILPATSSSLKNLS